MFQELILLRISRLGRRKGRIRRPHCGVLGVWGLPPPYPLQAQGENAFVVHLTPDCRPFCPGYMPARKCEGLG